MVKTILVERDIIKGMQLLATLDKQGIPIDGAFWYELPEEDEWRLFLVSPLADTIGPMALYYRIQSVLRAMESTEGTHFDLSDISVVGENDPVVQLMRGLFMTGDGIFGINMPAYDRYGIQLGGAYVYRMNLPPSKSVRVDSKLPKSLRSVIDSMVRSTLRDLLGNDYLSRVQYRLVASGPLSLDIVLRRLDNDEEASVQLEPISFELLTGKSFKPDVERVVKLLAQELGLVSDPDAE
jgi:hypothetical protein